MRIVFEIARSLTVVFSHFMGSENGLCFALVLTLFILSSIYKVLWKVLENDLLLISPLK